MKATYLPGKTQHLGGPVVKERGKSSNRVVSQSESGFSDFSYLGQAIHRPVCCTPELETSNVCISSSGTGNVCNRCTEPELVGNVVTCISTFSSDSNLSKENSRRGMSSVPDCPSVGRTRLVSFSSEAAGSSCSWSPMEKGSTVSPNIQNVASLSSSIPSSCLMPCNNACKLQAFLSLLPNESIKQKYLLPTICMITAGNLGCIGVSEGRWIPLILL